MGPSQTTSPAPVFHAIQELLIITQIGHTDFNSASHGFIVGHVVPEAAGKSVNGLYIYSS
mgnify:FL=1